MARDMEATTDNSKVDILKKNDEATIMPNVLLLPGESVTDSHGIWIKLHTKISCGMSRRFFTWNQEYNCLKKLNCFLENA